jgi:hypothetical protein
MVADLPLTVADFRDEEGLYLAVLQVSASAKPTRLKGLYKDSLSPDKQGLIGGL